MNIADLQQLVSLGESERLELKRTTSELRVGWKPFAPFSTDRADMCSSGEPQGRGRGQQVSEQTFHEIAAQLQRLEPPAQVVIKRIQVRPDREVISLEAKANQEAGPFTFDTRPFERVGNTTRKMRRRATRNFCCTAPTPVAAGRTSPPWT